MYCRRACLLILIAILCAVAACQPVPPPAVATAAPTAPAATVALQPTATATAQPTATAALTVTAVAQPTTMARLEPTPTQTPHGTPLLPEPCRPASGNRVYIRSEDAFCFSFPERFEIAESAPGRARIVGPALEKNPDPIRVSLELTATAAPAGSTLTGLVDEALAEFADFTAWEIKRMPTEVDGEPAVVVEPVPGLLSGRALYFLHDGAFYRLYFWPVDIELAQSDLAELYATTTGTFRFLPESAVAPTGKNITGVVK